MSFLRDLLNTGINPGDAQILDQHFANEADFVGGLEAVARVIGLQQSPSIIPPGGEPWKAIHAAILSNGVPPRQAMDNAIAAWPGPVQAAILEAVHIRAVDLQNWQAAAGTSTQKRKKTGDYAKALANLGYVFRFNLCTLNYEVNDRALTDGEEAIIRNKLRDVGIWETNVARDVYVGQAWQNRYHPVRDYLTGLTFNGGDPIGELGNYFRDEHGIFGNLIRYWLIGAVARVLSNQGLQNRMLILEGRKGLGKSELVRWLGSATPSEYYFEGAIDPDPKNKDYRGLLIKTWIWEVNEFSRVTRRSDYDELKAFLTTQQVEVRMPYERRSIAQPAMASFIGTTNNDHGIFNESDRRFMTCHLLEADWDYKKHVDLNQLWAQAVELYTAGERWEPAGGDLDTVNQINEEYRTVDLVEEKIKRLFVIEPGNQNLWMSSLEIFEILKDPARGNLKPGAELDMRKVAGALTRLGLEKPRLTRKGATTMRGYFGIRVGP